MNESPATQASIEPTATTQDERTMAVLAHVLQLVGGWIAPLVIFLVKRKSRFISFHALQVLLFQAILILITMIGMSGILVALGITFATGGFQNKTSSPPVFLFFVVFFLAMMISGLVKLVLAIVHGEWSEYPLLGRLARNIMHIGPGGTVIGD